jgi:hypothetical protein
MERSGSLLDVLQMLRRVGRRVDPGQVLRTFRDDIVVGIMQKSQTGEGSVHPLQFNRP